MAENKKYTLHMVFGSIAVREMQDEGIDDAIKKIKKGDGEYKKKEFNTLAEMNAYVEGLQDSNGWEDYCAVEDAFLEEDVPEAIEKIEKAFKPKQRKMK